MSFAEFLRSSAEDAAPPAGLSRDLQALWHDARGDWERAHALAQEGSDPESAWVHAYLHRKEGDEANAEYWYTLADRPAGVGDWRAEWEAVARALLAR